MRKFQEKPRGDVALINRGFFVTFPQNRWGCYPFGTTTNVRACYIQSINGFQARGFWQPMDKLKGKFYLEKLLEKNTALWKIWED